MTDSHDENRTDPGDVARMRELAGAWVGAQAVISAYVSANVVDRHHVEDIVQEVAQVCAEKFHEFDRRRSFASWAMGIARHRILKYYRTRTRDRLVLNEPALEQLEAALERLEPAAEERRDALHNCMAKIQGRRRDVLQMRYGENCRVADVAVRFGMSASAVSVMLHRVRTELLDCIRRTLAQGRA
ncbi:MAG: sigma-70 family RNA polymerase sigma factor [Pirellulales bacterium]|nr:sigma-70 family RNA polymerase sigma factor [Pirellulales bacterium]